MASATSNTAVGLPTAASITGKYTTSVTVGASSVVTIVMKAIGNQVTASDTITYTPTCAVGSGTTWVIGGTIATKFIPKS